MQDNNNSTSLTNGDTHASIADRYANIRAAEERKLLARNHANNSKKVMMDQLTKIPIPENDENEDVEKNSGRESGGTASTPVDADNTDSILLNSKISDKKTSHSRRYLEFICERYEISKKSRLPFLILSVLCFILLLTVIILAIVWPYIPSYMRSDVCIDQECFDASKQIVGWADLKEDVCENPYKFMCGNFNNQYRNHELYLVNKGEWSANSNFEYEDLNAVNSFISKLPNLPSRSSIQPMIKKIYTNCMNIRSEERTDENLQVLKTILETARK
ncbi:hypothetical protein PVAND_013822 [Polypedilum vanderplanki]|uniref:Peptidase M13 N-terminal domain-containing protein n=1 Tax=Polypedilum vanderplanki TaxID=319348 RepID=A0A9J6CRE4_POLVA|nr:hypothetical protein PVAND_013822 [Polypedilum vanderplanki]